MTVGEAFILVDVLPMVIFVLAVMFWTEWKGRR